MAAACQSGSSPCLVGPHHPDDRRATPLSRVSFVVKSERLDDKTVIHNYGHGGSGMSLSWGRRTWR